MRRGRLPAVLAVFATALACAPAAQAVGRCGDHPWCDSSLSPDTRAGLVLEQMTRDEKFELMAGDDADSVFTGPHTGIANGVPRLGIPPVFYTDGPAGIRQRRATGMPAPMGLAATFDPEMAAAYGGLIGEEARLKGNDVVH